MKNKIKIKNMKKINEQIIETDENVFENPIEVEIENVNENLELEDQTEATTEDINISLNSSESVNNPDTKRIQKSTKKSMSQLADEIVGAFLNDKSDKNWEKLQNFFWYGIKHYAFNYVKVMETAEDMTIDTFINAHAKIDQYDPAKGRFSTWLFTCCKNNCLYYLKQKSKLEFIDNDISDIFDSELISSAFASSIDDCNYSVNKDGVINKVENDEVTKAIYDAVLSEIGNFSDIVSKIMLMKYVDNMKIREIADELDMNSSTVKNYLYRGRENLVNIIKINHKELYESYMDNLYKESQIKYYA